jgi:hypothetical protein
MLQVIIRICPGGDKKRAYEQAVAEVANLSDLAEFSDYSISASENRNGVTGAAAWSSRGMIGMHDRQQSVGACREGRAMGGGRG